MLQQASCTSPRPKNLRTIPLAPPRASASPCALITSSHTHKHTRTRLCTELLQSRGQPWDSSSSSKHESYSLCPVLQLFQAKFWSSCVSLQIEPLLLPECSVFPSVLNDKVAQLLVVNMWSIQGRKYPGKHCADGPSDWLPFFPPPNLSPMTDWGTGAKNKLSWHARPMSNRNGGVESRRRQAKQEETHTRIHTHAQH